ncbi:hypothetical protein AB4305_21730 [Nocardia sp. 2YAB30]|uniref:hypothetical protein n=1 Tax=Nocardia sp. 2YAB30 TaxID=3233022 RepID=UPI003F9844C4
MALSPAGRWIRAECRYQAIRQRWLEREATFADPALPLAEVVTNYLCHALRDPRGTRLLTWRGLSDAPPSIAHGSPVCR